MTDRKLMWTKSGAPVGKFPYKVNGFMPGDTGYVNIGKYDFPKMPALKKAKRSSKKK